MPSQRNECLHTPTFSLSKRRPRDWSRHIIKQRDLERKCCKCLSPHKTRSFTQLTHVELQLRSVERTDGDKAKRHHAHISDRSTSVLLHSAFPVSAVSATTCPCKYGYHPCLFLSRLIPPSLPSLLLRVHRLPMQHL